MVNRLTNPLADRPAPLGNLLTAAARTLAAELDAGIAAAGFDDVRAAHAPVFQVIDPDGTRLTVLAERAGMTKQAMGELVRYLGTRGYVETVADPSDGRARLIRLTAAGWAVAEAGLAIVARFDEHLDAIVGRAEVQRLRKTLHAIIGGAGSTHVRAKPQPES
ncbi:MarR family winged helix-turn-helix transcriptional regulator [Nocardia crassostreae]|uniref:MarR family winged helix-turn-helix transcriptional regulator n=1 Tax=Nocardia crassostreae TaxID=53428 RepID=UPI00082B07EC|nr:MarR family winged helix-turn-helix transcriptional regulator [Nocardia crassostreae]